MSDERSDTVSTTFVSLLVLGTLAAYSGCLLVGIALAGSSGSPNYQPNLPPANYAATVEITNMLKFEPYEVTIKSGETVLWSNVSFITHTVTADFALAADKSHVMLPEGAKPFNSELIDPDQTWTKTFTVPGRYRYYCIPHEATGMVGEIVVE